MTEPAASSSRRPRWRRTFLAWGAPLLVIALLAFGWWGWGTREHAVAQLDPAQVRIVRTPGGMLEVATLQKV